MYTVENGELLDGYGSVVYTINYESMRIEDSYGGFVYNIVESDITADATVYELQDGYNTRVYWLSEELPQEPQEL